MFAHDTRHCPCTFLAGIRRESIALRFKFRITVA